MYQIKEVTEDVLLSTIPLYEPSARLLEHSISMNPIFIFDNISYKVTSSTGGDIVLIEKLTWANNVEKVVRIASDMNARRAAGDIILFADNGTDVFPVIQCWNSGSKYRMSNPTPNDVGTSKITDFCIKSVEELEESRSGLAVFLLDGDVMKTKLSLPHAVFLVALAISMCTEYNPDSILTRRANSRMIAGSGKLTYLGALLVAEIIAGKVSEGSVFELTDEENLHLQYLNIRFGRLAFVDQTVNFSRLDEILEDTVSIRTEKSSDSSFTLKSVLASGNNKFSKFLDFMKDVHNFDIPLTVDCSIAGIKRSEIIKVNVKRDLAMGKSRLVITFVCTHMNPGNRTNLWRYLINITAHRLNNLVIITNGSKFTFGEE